MVGRLKIPVWLIAGVIGLLLGFSNIRLPDLPFPTQMFAVLALGSFWLTLVVSVTITLLLLFSSVWISIAAHELGHFIAGSLANFEAQMLVVGRFSWQRIGTRWMFEFLRTSPLSGFYYGAPRGGQGLAGRFALVVAGGIAANFFVALLAIVGLLLVGAREYQTMDIAALWRMLLTFLFLVNSFLAVFNLVPFRIKGNFKSDGLHLWRIARGDPNVPRDMASLMLLGSARMGVKPRDWEPDLIQVANAIKDDTDEFATARLMRFAHLMDRGETQAAGVALDEAMTRIEKVNEMNRPNFWLEYANFLALYRNQPEAARSSLEEAAKYAVRPMIRLRAEAAVAFAERDYPRAVEKASAALEDFRLWGEPAFAKDDAEELRALMARAAASGADAV